MKAMERGDSNGNLHERIRDLENQHYHEKQRNNELSRALDMAETKSRTLEKRLGMQNASFRTASTRSISSTCSDAESQISRILVFLFVRTSNKTHCVAEFREQELLSALRVG